MEVPRLQEQTRRETAPALAWTQRSGPLSSISVCVSVCRCAAVSGLPRFSLGRGRSFLSFSILILSSTSSTAAKQSGGLNTDNTETKTPRQDTKATPNIIDMEMRL